MTLDALMATPRVALILEGLDWPTASSSSSIPMLRTRVRVVVAVVVVVLAVAIVPVKPVNGVNITVFDTSPLIHSMCKQMKRRKAEFHSINPISNQIQSRNSVHRSVTRWLFITDNEEKWICQTKCLVKNQNTCLLTCFLRFRIHCCTASRGRRHSANNRHLINI